MNAVVYRGLGDIGLEEVDDPRIEAPTDAVVKIDASAICGTDLHLVRGTMPGMVPGTVLGHEAVGTVLEVGPDVRNLRPGDRVVIPSTIACGSCAYCRAGYYAQCDRANPNGPDAGTCFFGGPAPTGPIQGLQADFARIPFAHTGPVRLPGNMSDDDAILLSDVLPTSWFAARLAEISPGDTVCVFGAGIVGQLAMASAVLQGAGRVLAVDNRPDRLDRCPMQGAEPINFDEEDPVEAVKRLTGGIGVDRVIDAVGVDANRPAQGPAAPDQTGSAAFERERDEVAPERAGGSGRWETGTGPSQVLRWAVQAAAKAGTIAVVGVYPPRATSFPIGEAMNKNLTINSGNCNHRRYLHELVDLVASEAFSLAPNLTQDEPFDAVIDAYEHFDQRASGWQKVKLHLAA